MSYSHRVRCSTTRPAITIALLATDKGNMLRQAIFIFCIDQYRAKRMEKLEGPSASRPRSKVQKELPRFLTENCSVEGCYKLKSVNSHSISESDWSLLCLLALAPTKNSCYLIRKQPSLGLVLGTFKMPDVALPVAQYCLADHRQDSLMDILKPPRISSIRRLGLYGFLLYTSIVQVSLTLVCSSR